ncbi:MAG: NRAMP family divalent metal transporter [Cetobacterium sp.]
MENKKKTLEDKGAIIGAAFLMATSAVGPGFLTQTAIFTEQFKLNFGFSILISIIVTLIVQLNIWRIIGVSGMRGQDIANKVIPGLGYFIAFAVALGGLAFNIGNVGGAALGLNVLFGLDPNYGSIIAGILGTLIFLSKDIGSLMDKFTKILGVIMIAVITYVAISTKPPLQEAIYKAFFPEDIKKLSFSLITLLGGSIGGYITFAGGHRLIDAKITGEKNLNKINESSVLGVVISSIIRVSLFLAILGVVSKGAILDPSNPPASAFFQGAGIVGFKIFGIVILAAALTSIVGAAYTSVSFLKTLFPIIMRYEKPFIIGFILTSTLTMRIVGRPVTLLILAGSLNGIILPLTLGATLLASRKVDVVGDYKHSKILTILGIVVVIAMGYAGKNSLTGILAIFK